MEEAVMVDYHIRAYTKPENREYKKQGTQTVYCEVIISNPDFVKPIKSFQPEIIAWNKGEILVSSKAQGKKVTYTLSTTGDGRESMNQNYLLLLRSMAQGLRDEMTVFLAQQNLNPKDRLVFSKELHS